MGPSEEGRFPVRHGADGRPSGSLSKVCEQKTAPNRGALLLIGLNTLRSEAENVQRKKPGTLLRGARGVSSRLVGRVP